MTPTEYLAQHPLTLHLKKLGLTDSQLAGVRFKQNDDDFSDWPVIALEKDSSERWPVDLLNIRHAWCALRWLILDNPPDSRDKRDAWDCVALYSTDHTYQAGAKHIEDFTRARTQANEKRKSQADNKALNDYRSWERRTEQLLTGMDTAARVARYLGTKRLGDRQQRRIRALLNAGRI
jgi:hypothetical protein